jgi:glycine oxidase
MSCCNHNYSDLHLIDAGQFDIVFETHFLPFCLGKVLVRTAICYTTKHNFHRLLLCFSMSTDVIILGGGVIGLSTACELAKHGASVTILDKQQFGQESSWAGAGIIPPMPSHVPLDSPLDRLFQWSRRLHPEWSQELLERTGIDNEYWSCGAWYIADTPAEQAELTELRRAWSHWQTMEIPCAIPAEFTSYSQTVFQPYEAQVRNPRHLQALLIACQSAGVQLIPNQATTAIHPTATDVSVTTTTQNYSAANLVLAAGAWTNQLTAQLGYQIPVKPLRGQIVLMQSEPGVLQHIVNQGPCYIVPRRDGKVLIGSTEEDVGYEKMNTAAAIEQLTQFALRLVPGLRRATVLKSWAGLRPMSAIGTPLIGRLPGYERVWLATGHHRQGVALSPATAKLLVNLLLQQPTEIVWPLLEQ